MAFRVQGEIRGLKELIRKLDVLKPSLARKYLRKAMRTSTSVVNKSGKANVRTTTDEATGQTKKSLGVKVKVYPSGTVIGVVEPRGGFKVARATGRGGKVRYHDPRRTAHLIERGTGLRRKKGGGSSGVMPARPFLFPAFTANESKVMGIFEAAIDEALATL